MHIQPIIDGIWTSHHNWTGLSYGQLAVLLLTYIIHQRSHRLSSMEEWVAQHHIVLEQTTGWSMRPKDATDDRLGILLSTLGSDEEQSVEFQKQLSSHIIQAYELPTQVCRYDTTSFSVNHNRPTEEDEEHELLRFGYSKDKRPDLLQFKQGLGTLDPAGIPLVTHTLSGETADDGLYIPAWREMKQIIGHADWLFVADCKAASLDNRMTIDRENGLYLFPLPMTGKTPEWLENTLIGSNFTPELIYLPKERTKDNKPQLIAQGFFVQRTFPLKSDSDADSSPQLTEQWFLTQSFAHAQRAKDSLHRRLSHTKNLLNRLQAQKDESATDFQQRAQRLLHQRKMTPYLSVTVSESFTYRKRYLRRGRPTPTTPFELLPQRHIELHLHLDQQALDHALHLAGWRLYVTNASSEQLSLSQAILYYRDEYLVENGFHRFKGGSLPTLPLFLRLPERIRGLMLLLFVALQSLTLLEFVAGRNLSQQPPPSEHTLSQQQPQQQQQQQQQPQPMPKPSLAGLVPGNPSIKTSRPSAERLLSAFDNLHLVVLNLDSHLHTFLHGTLTPLQLCILELLDLPPSLFSFSNPSLHPPPFQPP